MDVREKMWLTKDRDRLVPDGHPEAAFLFATPGSLLKDKDAKRFGIVDGTIPREEAQVKAQEKEEDKAVDEHEDKGRMTRRQVNVQRRIRTPAAPPERGRSGLTITRLEDKE